MSDLARIHEFLELDYNNYYHLSEYFQYNTNSVIYAINNAGYNAFSFYMRLPKSHKEYFEDSIAVCEALFKNNFYECYRKYLHFADALKCFNDYVLLNDRIWPLIMVQDRNLIFFKKYPKIQRKPDYVKMVLEADWAPAIINNFKSGRGASSYLSDLFNVNYLTDETLKFISEEIEGHIMPNILDKIKDENGIYNKDLLDKIQAEFKRQFKQLKAEKQKLDYKKSDKYIEDINQTVANFKLDDDDNEQLSIKLSK